MDINKVKSKSRAILNIKKEGEKLDSVDEEFIKQILKFHHKYDAKIKDFEHFEVDFHPEFNKTRCFFIVRKDGTKEDFSISKCIANLESQSNSAAEETKPEETTPAETKPVDAPVETKPVESKAE